MPTWIFQRMRSTAMGEGVIDPLARSTTTTNQEENAHG